MEDDEFRAFALALLGAVPARSCDTAAVAEALAYPWERPRGSFLLADEVARPLTAVPAPRRRALLDEMRSPAGGRLAVLAIGSNGCPAVLARKLADLEGDGSRTVLALAGRLHGFDVGLAAQPAIYGSLPATLFPSPETAVSAILLSLTPAQLTRVAWTEPNYRLGTLRARFEAREEGLAYDEALAFVSRFGAFSVDGRAAALAAVPASGRDAPRLTQVQALDAAAALALGPEARAETLVRAVFEDAATVAEKLADSVHAQAVPFASERWSPFPA